MEYDLLGETIFFLTMLISLQERNIMKKFQDIH